MKPFTKPSVSLLFGLAALATLSVASAQPPTGPAKDKNVIVMMYPGTALSKPMAERTQRAPLRSQQMSLSSYGPPVRLDLHGFRDHQQHGQTGGPDALPVWTFDVQHAARDGLNHVGAMVGTNPFTSPGTSRVPVVIIPLAITTHTVAHGIDFSTGTFTPTSPGSVTVNGSKADPHCLPAPNDVPSTVAYQSPIFQDSPIYFGNTFMGNTQYIDALQRAEFYGALGSNLNNYHVLFDPVQVARPIAINVPANEGLAFSPQATLGGGCGEVQVLDLNWFDSYINGTLLPQLASEGMTPGTIPVFLLYNAVMASPVTNLNTCCILGYHSLAGEPAPNETYAVSDFDSSGIFGSGTENSDVLAHEMGELVNDPYTDNEVPPWGNTGQVQGACQENLEVGDPLTGLNNPQIKMPNGFTYNVQELAFFSWFFGGQSIGVNGWYSSNGTFTSDAGPVCGDPNISSG